MTQETTTLYETELEKEEDEECIAEAAQVTQSAKKRKIIEKNPKSINRFFFFI